LENTIAARAGNATTEGFKDFMRSLQKQIEKPDVNHHTH
jgi:hypothetical protein